MARRRSRTGLFLILDYLGAALIFIAVALAAAFFTKLGSKDYKGPFTTLDGDTVFTKGQKLRLVGIDAPETSQKCSRDGQDWPCGKRSKAYLRGLMDEPGVICQSYGIDKYDRPLVICKNGNLDLNKKMVLSGWAVSYGDYYQEQSLAKAQKSGIWAGEFQSPRDWREQHLDDIAKNEIATGWIADFIHWINSVIR